jgi:CubicO group peptidase (beta-lactamase class C family)
MKKYSILTIVLLLFQFNLAKGQNLYFPPINNAATWDTLSPNALNWCTNQIPNLYTYLQSQDSKAFLVLKDGKIVLEKYFGTFTKDSLWYWASAGKSLTSVLVGKALEDNAFQLTDTSATYLGKGWTNCTSEQEAKITIVNQLSMTTGLADNVPDNHCTADSCLQYLADAGSRWAYHNAPYTLLEKVISNATGTDINTYTQLKLKNRTGITGFWTNIGPDNVFISKARSMARFGLLVQNNCIWNTDTLLKNSIYVNQMTQSSQSMNPAYGYLWWLNGKNKLMVPGSQVQYPISIAPDAPADMFAAIGRNGQLICISKSTGLVVVRIGNQANEGEVPFLLCNQIWIELNKVICATNSINEIALQPIKFNIYPNPASTQLHIDCGSIKPTKLFVSDLSGKQIIETSSSSEIDISALSDGIYTLQLQINGFNYMYKWVKQSH